ncbi:DUF7057 domain-containing protein [Morganella morganii]|uniref:DUF7057 domain-containing protein n=1 Tax=Morganella morganii TaxID=582 RepID=UPI001BD9D474|nr:DUF4153 domain-containing protein [Morganella morganii]MBT0308704.1 DUF4153 domain-containing protein [Morganella morganii subsp. morganii]
MKNDTPRESVSCYSYLFVIIMAVLQGGILYGSSDYSIRNMFGLSAPAAYLPVLLAIVVPSVCSYLISGLKSARFYICLVLAALLVCWMYYWYLLNAGVTSSSAQFMNSVIVTSLFFLLLPWMQFCLTTGRYNPGYTFLMSHYVRNTVLGAVACVIGLIVIGIIKIAVYLFSIVNFEYLSHLLDNELFYWLGFCIGLNISLVFMRGTLTFPVYKITAGAARALLPVLNIIAVIFVAGLLISAVSSVTVSGLGSSAMLLFIALNVILLNLVYDNEHGQFSLRSGFKYLLLCGILILNILTVMSLYGILIRVSQYSWTVERLYAFSAALFFTLLILAYSMAIIFRRIHLTGIISKAGLLILITGLILINSPVADFNRIAAGSILAGVDNGRLKVDSELNYTLGYMGKEGEKVLATLNENPEYRKALKQSRHDRGERQLLRDVILAVPGSPALPESWWEGNPDVTRSWFCTESSAGGECIGFMADADGNGQDDAVVCITGSSDSSFYCQIWQQATEVTDGQPDKQVWEERDYQDIQYASEEEKQAAWAALKAGHYSLKPKVWMMVVPEPEKGAEPEQAPEVIQTPATPAPLVIQP